MNFEDIKQEIKQTISDIDLMLNFFKFMRKEFHYYLRRFKGESILKTTKKILSKYLVYIEREPADPKSGFEKYIIKDRIIFEEVSSEELINEWENGFKEKLFECLNSSKLLNNLEGKKSISEILDIMKSHFQSNPLIINFDLTNRKNYICLKMLGEHNSKYLFPNFDKADENQHLFIEPMANISKKLFGINFKFRTKIKTMQFVIFEKVLSSIKSNHTVFNDKRPNKTIIKSTRSNIVNNSELNDLLKYHISQDEFKKKIIEWVTLEKTNDIIGPKAIFDEKIYVTNINNPKITLFRFKYSSFEYPVLKLGNFNEVKYMVIKHITPAF